MPGRLTDENHFIELLALSPDGTRIAFDSDRSGNADIWTIGVTGKGLETGDQRSGTRLGAALVTRRPQHRVSLPENRQP